MADQTLADLRQQIDAIDDQILALLNRRAELVIESCAPRVPK